MSDRKRQPIDRRYFLKWLGGGLVLGGAAALGLGACGPEPTVSSLTPQPRPTEDAWRWQIRWISRVPQVDVDEWRLRIDGLVEQSLELTLAELRALPSTTISARMKCVECWSGRAEWTGVAGEDLLALVQPLPGAEYVTLHALDGYTSTLTVAELVHERVLFVYGMDGQDLPAQQGYPLRLMAPAHYGYKCVKALDRLEFVDSHVKGYWELRGYDNVGIIRPGVDRPLDLEGTRRIGRGEITDY